jgi:hypothetical protein
MADGLAASRHFLSNQSLDTFGQNLDKEHRHNLPPFAVHYDNAVGGWLTVPSNGLCEEFSGGAQSILSRRFDVWEV